jgi:NAD(P)-dependent dehydrogenase (short-subunit alcohol dehydrogenase family)
MDRLADQVALVTGASRGGGKGIVLASRLAAPPMIEAGRGLIVNMTWVLDRPHGHAYYEVARNGTSKLTGQLADDLRP